MNIFIWMFIAYIPFLWYWVKMAILQMSETEDDKVKRKLRRNSNKTYWGGQ